MSLDPHSASQTYSPASSSGAGLSPPAATAADLNFVAPKKRASFALGQRRGGDGNEGGSELRNRRRTNTSGGGGKDGFRSLSPLDDDVNNRIRSMTSAVKPIEEVVKNPEHIEETYERLSCLVTYTWGAPQFTLLSVALIGSVFLVPYYELLGANLALIAFFTALSRATDTLSDPLMAWISDNFRSRWGRRRPFMTAGCVGFAVTFICLVAPPYDSLLKTPAAAVAAGAEDRTPQSLAYWYGIFLILFFLFYTISGVPYTALGPELSADSRVRTKVFFCGRIYANCGTLVGLTSPAVFGMLIPSLMSSSTEVMPMDVPVELVNGTAAPLTPSAAAAAAAANATALPTVDACGKSLNNDVQDETYWSFVAMGVMFSTLFVLSIALVVASVKERQMSLHQLRVPLVPSILRTMKNNAFRPLLYGWIFDSITLSCLTAMFPFYIAYVIKPCKGDPSVDQVLGMCFALLFVAVILSAPLWLFIVHRIGKYRTYMLYNLANLVTNAAFIFLGEGDWLPLVIITFFNGFPMGGNFIADSLVADVIDYDEFLNGTRNEGGFSVFATFLPKIVSIPASAIPLSIMASIGFVPSINGIRQPQKPAVREFIRIVFCFLPMLSAAIAVTVKRWYPIRTEEQITEIKNGIEKHNNGVSAVDPVTGDVVGVLKLTADEQVVGWKLDCFSHKELNRCILTGETQWLVNKMLVYVIAMVCAGVAFFALTVGFFTQLDDASLSIVPTLSVVFLGLSVSLLVVCVARYINAKALAAGAFPYDLAQRIISAKRQGARGGDLSAMDMVVSLRETVVDLKARLDLTMSQLALLQRRFVEFGAQKGEALNMKMIMAEISAEIGSSGKIRSEYRRGTLTTAPEEMLSLLIAGGKSEGGVGGGGGGAGGGAGDGSLKRRRSSCAFRSSAQGGGAGGSGVSRSRSGSSAIHRQ